MANAKFEIDSGKLLTEPKYFYRDDAHEDSSCMLEGLHRWLCTVDTSNLYLPEMLRMRALSHL